MYSIREGVFETNSSSVHSLTFTTEERYQKFRWAELFYCSDVYDSPQEPSDDNLYSREEILNIIYNNPYTKKIYLPEGVEEKDLLTISEDKLSTICQANGFDVSIYDNYGEDYEFFDESYTTQSGDKIVAFGYYGDE